MEWIEQKSQPFYTATPDQDGLKSQLRDWKILLVLTLIKVLKQCPIESEKISPPSVSAVQATIKSRNNVLLK